MARRQSAEVEIEAAEVEEARRALAEGGVVRIASGGRVFLCTTVEDVIAAQRGRVTPGAVRLDGRAG